MVKYNVFLLSELTRRILNFFPGSEDLKQLEMTRTHESHIRDNSGADDGGEVETSNGLLVKSIGQNINTLVLSVLFCFCLQVNYHRRFEYLHANKTHFSPLFNNLMYTTRALQFTG